MTKKVIYTQQMHENSKRKQKKLTLKRLSPRDAAKMLVDSGMTVSKYMVLQEDRNKRLQFFTERGIDILIKNEHSLIAYGEQVLFCMKAYVLVKMIKDL